MVEIKESNEFGRLPLIELEDFELVNEIKLPDDYRNFLLEFNGGVPSPNLSPRPDTVVSYIFGMHNGQYYASLYKHIDMFNNRLPFGTFPIASDPFGNLFIMSVDPGGHGHIYFWDHEGEPEVQDGHYTENCSFVAYSFTEFLNNLAIQIGD